MDTTTTSNEQTLIHLAESLTTPVADPGQPTAREIRQARHALGAAALTLSDEDVEDVLTMSALTPDQRPLYITAMRPAPRPTLGNIAEATRRLASA